jgi:hypothetical protein
MAEFFFFFKHTIKLMEFLLFVIFTAWLGLLSIAQLDLALSLAKPKSGRLCWLGSARPCIGNRSYNGIAGNTKGGSITVPLTSCLTGLELVV